MALQLYITKNAKNVAEGDVPARSLCLHVADDATGLIDLTKGKITLQLGPQGGGDPDVAEIIGTQGSDATNHEIKLRQVNVPVTIDGVVNCTDWAAIVLMSEPFLK